MTSFGIITSHCAGHVCAVLHAMNEPNEEISDKTLGEIKLSNYFVSRHLWCLDVNPR
jgi:hypothetical protein